MGTAQLIEIESYYPRIHVRPTNPRVRKVKADYPGFVFGRLDLEQTILPCSSGYRGQLECSPLAGYRPMCRTHCSLQSGGGSIKSTQPKPVYIVTVQDGPFRGHEAIFDAHISGDGRARVLLKLVSGSQFRLELPERQIQRIKQ